MINVVGVRFQNTGKSYYFDPLEFEVKRGTHVIVETQRGREFGTVTIPPILVKDEKVVQPLRPILRLATEEDECRNAENRERSVEAGKICREKIAKYGLEMKLVETEYTFDRSKLLFYFTADGRVDFRELVKDLASVFHTRIELRQIGVRDETKIKGGLGMCGRELCCTTFLSDFAPVSIRMAKEQNLSLNPSKISGACGRLMCCLKNEQETYEYLNKQLPKNGTRVNTIDGIEGTVQSVNILKQTAKVVLDIGGEKEIREYTSGELAYGDKDFECEPRRNPQEDMDYFSQQLKMAVASLPEEEEKQTGEHHGRRGGRNRGRKNAGGENRQTAEKRQEGNHGSRDANPQSGEKRRNEKRQHRKNTENPKNADIASGQEKSSRGRGGKQGASDRQQGKGQSTDAAKRKNTQQAGGQKTENQSAQNGSGNLSGQEKSSRSRSRNRYRSRRSREGKQQQGENTGSKQSDS